MKAPTNNVVRSAPFTLRAASDGDGHTLEGYAAVFGSTTRIDSWEGRFDETIERGAFTKTIDERTPVLQFDHGQDTRTGTVPIGAIHELREDNHGLFVRARLHDNPVVEPIRQAMESGALDGMSFRFRVLRDEWNEDDDVPVRAIREVDLFELGPVVFPAYEATSVGVRSLLAPLTDEDRTRLLDELRPARTDAAAETGTSDDNPDAGERATSGSTPIRTASVIRNAVRKRTRSAK